MVARSIAAAALLSAFAPQLAAGQWWGTVFDKLGEWSGPNMIYYGLTYRVGYQPTQRLATGRLAAGRDRLGSLAGRNRDQSELLREIRGADACFGEIEARIRPLADGYEESVVDAIRRDLSRLDDVLNDLERADTVFSRAERLRVAACDRRDALMDLTLDPLGPHASSGWVLRFGLFTGFDLENNDRAVNVYGLMLKNTVEYNWTVENGIQFLRWAFRDVGFGIEAGVNTHYMHGSIDPFWYATFPLALNVYPFARRPWGLFRNLKGGVGLNVLPPHEFPEIPEYRRTDLHLSGIGFHFGLDISVDWILEKRPYE